MFKYLRLILIVGFRILYDFLFYINRYARHPERYPFMARYNRIRNLIIKVNAAFGVDYNIKDFENFTNLDGKCVLISNHLSDCDPLIFIAMSEKPLTFVSKQEAFKYPFVGKCIKALEGIPLDRENLRSQIEAVEQIVKVAKHGVPNVVIFAEGTRNKQPGTPCLEFKGGSIKIAIKAEVPIVPVSLYGTFRVFSSKINIKKYPVFFDFFKPITPDDYKDIKSPQLASSIKEMVDEALQKNKKLDKEYIEKMPLSDKKKSELIAPDLL